MDTWIVVAEKLGSSYNVYVPILGNLLCFFTGMSMSWSSPVLAKLNGTNDNPLGDPITTDEIDLIGSVFSIGGTIGPLVLILSLEIIGRKLTMSMLGVILSICHLILAFTTNIYVYYVCRVISGISVSGSFGISAVYVAEICSGKWRGTYISLGTSFILSGGLISYSLGPYIPLMYFNLIIAVPTFFYSILFTLTCPESLYYTMQKYGTKKTTEILNKLRKGDSIKELNEIETSVRNSERGSFFDIFKSIAGRKAFMICTSLLLFQQFCGVTIIITYSQKIFEEANVSVAPEICSIIISAFQTLTCFITPVAATHVDRKILLSCSFFGVALSNILLGLYFSIDAFKEYQWIPLVALISFVIFYNCGTGPIPWITLGELYPLKVRSVGTAVSNTIYWGFQFVLTFFFNKIDKGISFLAFGGLCLGAVLFVKLFMIETRGKSLEEVQNKLEK